MESWILCSTLIPIERGRVRVRVRSRRREEEEGGGMT